jgi:hypothetical protein
VRQRDSETARQRDSSPPAWASLSGRPEILSVFGFGLPKSREQDLLLMPTTRMMASPLGEGDRPIGLMLIGKHWQESTLYRAADVFERAGDW